MSTPQTVEYTGVDDITLVGDEWNVAGERPSILMLHGGGQNRHSWKNTGQVLADQGFHVVALDTRGHGDSDRAPGAELANIETLRTLRDADRILDVVQASARVVIIGASFIGMEAAASLAGGHDLDVTVVGREVVPFENNFGMEIGGMLQRVHEENGVKFRMQAEFDRFEGSDGRVTGVRLKDGELLPADVVLVGIGVRPATDFLHDSALKLNERDKSVHVDARLQAAEDVYAAGDIARYEGTDGESWRIEHWRVAQQHGIVAASNMRGGARDVNAHVPFFWTNQWTIGLRYVGHASDWDEIIYRGGTPDTREFVAFYIHDGVLVAAAGVKRDREMDAIEFILRDRLPLTPAQMRDADFDLVAYAQGDGHAGD